MAPTSPHAVGIDRWRGGWVIAEVLDGHLRLSVADHIEQVRDSFANAAAVAIDMPIALATQGRRVAESELRGALGAASRSVFTSPTRVAVQAATQAEATELNRANDGPGISAQAFGLFASICELRSSLRGAAYDHWWETHPETSFVVLNGGTPMASKRSALGSAQRLAALRPLFESIDEVLLTSPAKVPLDDVLDAVVAAWSAQRIGAGEAIVYGPEGRDDEGFAEGIRV